MTTLILFTNALKTKCRLFIKSHPLGRGMVSYAILWPTGSLIQQTMEGKNLKTYDWLRVLRFGIYGGLYAAPMLYCWVRFTSAIWPQKNFRTALTKAFIGELTYGPFCYANFYLVMSLLELKTFEEAIKETKQKFWPTYKVGFCTWLTLHTINFAFIPDRNRIVYVSICSLCWSTYLAYMKMRVLENPELKQNDEVPALQMLQTIN